MENINIKNTSREFSISNINYNKKLLQKYTRWLKFTKDILTSMFPGQVNQSLYLLYERQVTKLVTNNGFVACISYLKRVRGLIYKYISSDSHALESGVRLTKDGIPVFLQDFIPFIRQKHRPSIQALLSLLNIGRLFKDVGTVVLDTIETQNNVITEEIINDDDIKSFLSHYSIDNYEIAPTKFFIRSSRGPLGPAMTSVTEEAKILSEKQYKSIKTLIVTSEDGADSITSVLDQCRNNNVPIPDSYTEKFSPNKYSRKITVVEDKEFKNRVIAILDY
jgi:hypothetical protein